MLLSCNKYINNNKKIKKKSGKSKCGCHDQNSAKNIKEKWKKGERTQNNVEYVRIASVEERI